MFVRTMGTLGLFVMMVLAGCIGQEGETESDDPSSTTPPAGNNTTMPTQPPSSGNISFSTPPEANLTAVPENGSVPLTVNFTIDATDPDGDLASWSLDFGDGNETNGTEFPDEASHEYAAEGNYSAVLNVTDAVGQSAQANITVVVEGSNVSIVYEGEVSRDCFQCSDVSTDFCLARRTGQNGSDCVWIELPPEAVGQPFVANSTGGDPDIRFYEECVSGTTSDTFAEEGPESGEVPEDTGCVLMWEYSDAPSTITITIG